MKSAARAGFTLLELLVALAIITILGGLITAAVQSARNNAALVECTGNLKQWGTALGLYLAEHDGATPYRGQGKQPLQDISRDDDWFNALPPYFNSPPYKDLVSTGQAPQPGQHSVFVCPTATREIGANYFMAYAMNFFLSQRNLPEPQRIQQIPQPERTVFMADGPGGHSSAYPVQDTYSVKAPHSHWANLVFLDGHVQSYRGSELGCRNESPSPAPGVASPVIWDTSSP